MNEPCHGIVFRDVAEHFSTREAVAALRAELRVIAAKPTNSEYLLSALLRAGELECWLVDAGHAVDLPVTHVLAAALLEQPVAEGLAELFGEYPKRLNLPAGLKISRPEGFAFYGVHPLDYVDAVRSVSLSDGPVVVIGIRSIGATLSAVVAAALRESPGEREIAVFTVRPCGHPYDRKCIFPEHHTELIDKHKRDAQFVIVDEGPGLSGSSFLSVGEALVELGVSHTQVVFMCSRAVDPANLVTANGTERWRRFRSIVVPRNHIVPEEGAVAMSAGQWRKSAIRDESEWPGIWTTMCAPQYQSADGEYVFEYEGLGWYGDALRERTHKLAEGGFVLPSSKAANGYSRRKVVGGKRLTKSDAAPAVLEHMAGYLAFRSEHLHCDAASIASETWENMARINIAQALGKEYAGEVAFLAKRPVIADGSMMPHQWMRCDQSGELLKLDAVAHGDNHFFPGPVDIAWDLAGVIAEWELDADAASYLVHCYEERSGESNVMRRLPSYQLGYCAFRNAYCRMAASAMQSVDRDEARRLSRDANRYAETLKKMCATGTAALAASQE